MNEAGNKCPLLILVTLVILLAALILPTTPVKADPGWVIETVDSDASVGQYSSLALDSNGNPHISYYDSGNGDLKYASYNGTAWNIDMVDSVGDVGLYTSLAIDNNDHPHISYYHAGWGNLKYATDNGTGWNIQGVDTDGDVGKYTSLALDISGRPHIAYFLDHTTDPYLKYASWNGSSWDIEDVRRVGAWFISLALDSQDYAHISFHNTNTKDLRYISDNGTAWNIANPDSSLVSWTSIALDSSDRAHISYTKDIFDSDLRYISDNGTDWNIVTVDSVGSTGKHCSLELDNDDRPHISYFDNTNGHLKYASDNGTAWNVVTVDNAYRVGDYSSLALDANGYPHISYYQEISLIYPEQGHLKYARFVPAPGLAVSKGGTSISQVGDNITYWVAISNTGDVLLQKVSVSDNRSGVVTDISGWFSGTIAVGASENRTYTYVAQAGDPNPLINIVTAVYEGAGFPNLSVSDNHSLTLLHPSISVSKGGPAISKAGDTVNYWAAVTNTGDCTLEKDSVSDSLVAGISDQFADTLASGVTDNQTYTYVVQEADPDPLLNTVTALYYMPGFSNVISDNATCTVDLVHPNILVTKAVAAGAYRAGDNITYLLSINNTSTDITLVKDSIIDSLAGDIASLFSDNITAGGSDNQTYTYTVKVTDPDPLLNEVTVHYHPDGLPNDITDNTTATVFLAPTITSVTPNQGNQGQTLDIVITGSQLNRVNAVDFGAGITVNSLVNSATQITANISIDAAATPEPRDVIVNNLGGSDNLTGGFTVLQPTQNLATSTGTGTATFATSSGTITGLTAVAQGNLTCGLPPAGNFPNGFFSFNITNIAPGATVTITITLPSNMPLDTQYWKCQNGAWVNITSLIGDNDGDNVLTLTLTDGGLGDADGAANGTIVDPGGPAIAVATGAPGAPGPRASPTPPNPLNPAQMSLQYLSISSQQASAGQPVTITTNVVNTGDEAGNYNVVLKINGQVEQSRMVSVGPQGTQPVRFTITKAQPGTYTVNIGDQKRSFIVTAAGSRPGGHMGEGLLLAATMAVIVILLGLLIVVARRRLQGY